LIFNFKENSVVRWIATIVIGPLGRHVNCILISSRTTAVLAQDLVRTIHFLEISKILRGTPAVQRIMWWMFVRL